ncbi:MAG TPA: TonB-dependent receptor [Alphaproteobacteria bacterium]|nr:TonB-dependent receptor [Alphaproteobacteria bacterium]
MVAHRESSTRRVRSTARVMRGGFLVGAAAGALVAFSNAPATAQQADQPTASAGGSLEEIVVTARRREERLQTVPIGITAFNGAQIAERGIQSLSDLQHYVPSLEVRQQDRNSQNFFMRGQGINGTSGAWPGVVAYFADVPWVISGPGNYVDIDSLQALRGPQGTLFGRNTTGGAVLLEPKKPTNDFEGYGQVIFGDYAREEVEGAVNIPVVQDKLLVRISGSHEVMDGFTRDVSTGQDLDNRDYWAGRVYIVARPTDDFENDLIYQTYYSHTNGGSVLLTGFNPNNIPGQPKGQFVTLFGSARAQAALAEQQALGPRATDTGGMYPLDVTYHWGVIDTARWDITDDLTVKNIASIQDMRNRYRVDQTGLPLKLLQVTTATGWSTSWEQYTEELQFQGKALDDKLSWTAGGYLEFLHPAGQTVASIIASPAVTVTSGAVSNNADGPANQTSRSQALYAQGTYDLSQFVDGLKFTAGYRYTWDWRSMSVAAFTTSFGPKICTQIGGTIANNCTLAMGAPFQDPSWTLSLDYQLSPDTLIYVTGSHGYKSGGFNNNTPSLALVKYGSERMTNAEIGMKTDWEVFGIKARTNLDGFHDTLANAQRSLSLQVLLPTGTSQTQTIVSNADVTIEGIEFDGQLIPFQGLEFSGSYSYDYANYDGPVLIPTVGSFTGIPYPAVPRNQLSITGRYHLPIDESYGDLSVAAVWSHRSHDQFATDNSPEGSRPGYSLLDLRLDWNSIMGRPFDLSFFVTNVTDKVYTLGVYDLYNTTGTVSDVLGEPRMFGVQVKYRFGPGVPAAF